MTSGLPALWLGRVWAFALPALILGPAMAPGFVLTYDMVWVPDLALREGVWGLGAELPRAVPSDAVIGVLDEVVPGMVLQKLVLYGSLVLAGFGIHGLVPTGHTVSRLVAITFYVWNPFVAERLLMGHWTLLLSYAVLPWLVILGRRAAREKRIPALVWVLLPLGSLSAGAGLVTAAVAVAVVGCRVAGRSRAVVFLAIGLANAPWVVTGLLHASYATSAASGADVFSARGHGALPAWLSFLNLAGIWNAEVVLPSRATFLAWVSVAFVIALAVLGVRRSVAWSGRRESTALAACASLGMIVTLLSSYAAPLLGWLAASAPGGGLLRDGSKFLALAAPWIALAVSAGADAALSWVRPVLTRIGLGLALTLFPIMVLPDLGWGASGRLVAVEYPEAFDEARGAIEVAQQAGRGGDVLLLPFTSYRAPDWNRGRKVLDPTGRYFTPDFVASDDLVVSGSRVPGENPRGDMVMDALARPTAAARSEALRLLGIRFVARSRGDDVDGVPPPRGAEVPGRTLVRASQLEAVALRGPVQARSGFGTTSRLVAVAAWGAFLGLPFAALLGKPRGRRGREDRTKR